MPYYNHYNQMILEKLNTIRDNYLRHSEENNTYPSIEYTEPYSMVSDQKIPESEKYNNDGNGFASGTQQDTGFDEVL